METNNLKNFTCKIKCFFAAIVVLFPLSLYAQKGGFTTESLPDMNTARMECRAALFPDSSFVIFGGHVPGFERTNTAEILTPRAKNWTQMTMSDYRDNSAAARIDSNRIMLAGGMSSGYGVGQLSSTEIYDCRTRTFTPAAGMNVARTMFTGARLNNGNLLFVGNWYNTAATAEIYHTMNNTFTSTGNVVAERCGPYIVPKQDNGAVIFGGGTPYGGNVETVEVFNYQNNSFTKLRDNLLENETGWRCSRIYPNSSLLEEEMTLDGLFYFSAYKDLSGNNYKFKVLTLDPDSLKFSTLFSNEELFTYIPGDSLYPDLAGKVILDKKLKRVYFWVNNVLLNSNSNYAMSLYYWDITKKELLYSPGYNMFEYQPHMGVNIVLPDGKLLVAGGNYTSNFDAHQHCFIANPVEPVTGFNQFEPVFNNSNIRAFAEKSQLKIFLKEIPEGNYSIKLTDIQGKNIQSIDKNIFDGVNIVHMPLDIPLGKGCYLIEIVGNQQRFKTKLISY